MSNEGKITVNEILNYLFDDVGTDQFYMDFLELVNREKIDKENIFKVSEKVASKTDYSLLLNDLRKYNMNDKKNTKEKIMLDSYECVIEEYKMILITNYYPQDDCYDTYICVVEDLNNVDIYLYRRFNDLVLNFKYFRSLKIFIDDKSFVGLRIMVEKFNNLLNI